MGVGRDRTELLEECGSCVSVPRPSGAWLPFPVFMVIKENHPQTPSQPRVQIPGREVLSAYFESHVVFNSDLTPRAGRGRTHIIQCGSWGRALRGRTRLR